MSRQLAAALRGVTRVELFLGGEVVRSGLAEEELAEFALKGGAALVLPSGEGLATVARAGPMEF